MKTQKKACVLSSTFLWRIQSCLLCCSPMPSVCALPPTLLDLYLCVYYVALSSESVSLSLLLLFWVRVLQCGPGETRICSSCLVSTPKGWAYRRGPPCSAGPLCVRVRPAPLPHWLYLLPLTGVKDVMTGKGCGTACLYLKYSSSLYSVWRCVFIICNIRATW